MMPTHRLLRVLATCCLLATPASAWLHADTVESFEGPDVSWTLSESDCQAQAVVHQRRLQGAHSGQGCEFLRLQHGQGSAVYLTHRIEASPVIAEWSPSLWLKADRPGLQLLARVVLPRTIDPQSGKPLTTFLFGTSYTRTTLWQHLTIDNPLLGLERQIRALRSQWGPHIDARQAYVDMLVINAYAHGGATQIWIDDLEVRGHVDIRVSPMTIPFSTRSGLSSPDEAANSSLSRVPGTTHATRSAGDESLAVRHASWETPTDSSSDPRGPSPGQLPSSVQLQGSLLTVARRPFLPRVIRWRGEPLDWLKDLGFNTLLCAEPPTAEQVAEARRLDLWLIVPPPLPIASATPSPNTASNKFPSELVAGERTAGAIAVDARLEPAEYDDRVLAWHVGGMTSWQLPELDACRAQWNQQIPIARRRPIVGIADSSLHEWSRRVDVLATDLWSHSHVRQTPAVRQAAFVDIGTASSLLSDIRPGVGVWADVPLPRLPEPLEAKPARQLGQQPKRQPTSRASTAAFPEPTLAAEGPPEYPEGALVRVRWTVYQAVSDGARGFMFHAPDSLEPGRGELRPLLSTVRAINAELTLLEPWIAAGSGVDRGSASDSRYQVRILHNDRSRLAVILRDAEPAESQPERGHRRINPTSQASSRGRAYLSTATAGVSFIDPGATNGAEAYEVTPQGLRPLPRRRVTGGVEVSLERTPAFALVLLTQQPVVVNYMSRRLATGRGSPTFR